MHGAEDHLATSPSPSTPTRSSPRRRPTAQRAPSRRAARRLAVAALLVALGTTSSAQSEPPLGGATPGLWHRDSIPDGWVLVETRTYQVQSRIGHDRAAALANHLDGLLGVFRELLPATGKTERLVVKLLADEEEYRAYAPGKGGAVEAEGRYDRASGEVVIWNTGIVLGREEVGSAIRLDEDRMHTLTYGDNEAVLRLLHDATVAHTPDLGDVLARQAWRQYLDRRVFHGKVEPLPAWLDRGLAEHAATARPNARGDYRTGLSPARIRELAWMLLDGDTVPVADLIRPQPDAPAFDAGPGPAAEGWALVHFLLESEDPARQQLLPRLLSELSHGRSLAEAAELVFDGVDLEQLQTDWRAWVGGLGWSDPLAELVQDYGNRVRPDQLTGDERLRGKYSWLWRRGGSAQPPGFVKSER